MVLELPTDLVVGLLLATFRTASFLLIAPPFSHRGIPVVVKSLLAFALAFAVRPEVPPELLRGGLDAGTLAVAVTQEVLAGSALGFLCYLVFSAVQAAGDLLDVFGGFSLAYAFDPLTQSGSSVLGRTYQLTALALLFASDAHLLILRGLLRTFDVLPLGQSLDLTATASAVTSGLTELVLAALQISAPLIAVLFLADVGLGLLTRVAPALNAFALGFPLKILLTLVMVGLGFSVLPQVVESLAGTAVDAFVGTARG